VSDKLPKHLFAVADGVVIVYSIDDEASFQIAEVLKKEAEKHKEKKEVRVNKRKEIGECQKWVLLQREARIA
jgi:D-tyrosyl-tRNA(Tyr) deacylase